MALFGKRNAQPNNGFVDLTKKAAVSLEKHNLSGQRAAVYLVVDRSGSMSGYFRSGLVQHLADRVLALSANLDDDGVVPVAMFSSSLDRTFDLEIGRHEGEVDRQHQRAGRMGGTMYAPAIKWVIDHYQSSGATVPALVVFQTDGAPADRVQAKQLINGSNNLPIKWDFHGWGPGTQFLDQLDTMNEGVDGAWDSVSTLNVGSEPALMPDEDLYDHLAGTLAAANREYRP